MEDISKESYRSDFGMHQGATVHDVPAQYRNWLISDRVYVGRKGLENALIEGRYLDPTDHVSQPDPASNRNAPPTPRSPPAQRSPLTPRTPQAQRPLFVPHAPPPSVPLQSKPLTQAVLTYVTPSSLDQNSSTSGRKRKALNEIPEPVSPSPAPRAKRAAIFEEARRTGTMLNFDNSNYILNFGAHAQKRLNEVPPSYINYLIRAKAHVNHPDLAVALREAGVLPPENNDSPLTVIDDTTWIAPSVHSADARVDKRFWDQMNDDSPRWISDRDSFRYFGLDDHILSRLNIRPLSEADLWHKCNCRPVTSGHKRWLYQVYAAAGRNGGNSAERCLMDFLAKNQTQTRSSENIRRSLSDGIR